MNHHTRHLDLWQDDDPSSSRNAIEQDFEDFKQRVKESRQAERTRFKAVQQVPPQCSSSLSDVPTMSVGSSGSSSSTTSEAAQDEGIYSSARTSSGSGSSSACLRSIKSEMQLQEGHLPRPLKRRRRCLSRELSGSSQTSSGEDILDKGKELLDESEQRGNNELADDSEEDSGTECLSDSDGTGEEVSDDGSSHNSGEEPEGSEGPSTSSGSDIEEPEGLSTTEVIEDSPPSRRVSKLARTSSPMESKDSYISPFRQVQHGKDSTGKGFTPPRIVRDTHGSIERLRSERFDWDHFRRGQLQAHPSRGTNPRNRCVGGPHCPLSVCSGFPSTRNITYYHHKYGY